MATRKTAMVPPPERPELKKLIENARSKPLTDEQLQKQRASFVYGNASAEDAGRITKESATRASLSNRLHKAS